MFVVCIEASARISGCRSLKDKRSLVSRAMTELRKRFSVSVAETAEQDKPDMLCLGVAAACSDNAIAQHTAQAIEDWFYDYPEFINPDVQASIV